MTIDKPDYHNEIVRLIQEAGGQIVGRTRLQKMACLLELAGVGCGFQFAYHYFGPYSEDISTATERAVLFDQIKEEINIAQWGGTYSTYSLNGEVIKAENPIRQAIIDRTVRAGAIALELAVTAAFLAKTGTSDPWIEVKERKPEKASKLDEAKELYKTLFHLAPGLPDIC